MSVAVHLAVKQVLLAMTFCTAASASALARSGDPEHVAMEVLQAIKQMQSDLAYVRSYAGQVTLSSGLIGPAERDEKSARLSFRVGISKDVVGVVYESVQLPKGRVPGLPVLSISEPQTRLFDRDGAVLIRAKSPRPIRLDADFNLACWESNEHFIASPQLIAGVLATWGADPTLARSTTSLGFRGWGETNSAGDRFMECDPWKDRTTKSPHTHYANCGRRVRFAAKYDYRPDLILVTTRSGRELWESWRITWVQTTLGARKIWFPSVIQGEIYNILEAQNETTVPRPRWQLNAQIDLNSLSTVVPFSLSVPKLPPGTQRTVITNRTQNLTAEQMEARYRQALREAGEGSPNDEVGPLANVTATDTGGVSAGWRVIIVASAILTALVGAKWAIGRFRRAAT